MPYNIGYRRKGPADFGVDFGETASRLLFGNGTNPRHPEASLPVLSILDFITRAERLGSVTSITFAVRACYCTARVCR
jgi:hypothetical protein